MGNPADKTTTVTQIVQRTTQRNMKRKISFIQMLTRKLFRIRIKPKPREETGEDSVIPRQSDHDRVTKTISLPPCRDSTVSPVPHKPFKKRKYHSQKDKTHNFEEFQLGNINSKPKKKLSRRKLSLRNVGARRLNESCPDLKSEFYSNFNNNGVDRVDAVDVNSLQLFRDISVAELEFIE